MCQAKQSGTIELVRLGYIRDLGANTLSKTWNDMGKTHFCNQKVFALDAPADSYEPPRTLLVRFDPTVTLGHQ